MLKSMHKITCKGKEKKEKMKRYREDYEFNKFHIENSITNFLLTHLAAEFFLWSEK